MALRAQPSVFAPLGLYDSLDGTNSPPGSCWKLSNLIHDITTPMAWTGRPAALSATVFPGFTTPGFGSVEFAVGTRIYGMIASGRNAGHDEPFCYDTTTNTFVTISGITAGNTPTSPATSGDWVPPTMDIIGSKIIVTHPGFSGAAGVFFGVIDIVNPATPAWSSANTTTNLLPSVPLFVVQFNNRAWYACKNQLWFSDALTPLVITNATNVLNCGDSGTNLTGAIGMSLLQTTGGILAGLAAFKASQGYWQITGDITTTNLILNGPIGTVGCAAPRTLRQTPLGILFLGVDGIRIIGFDGIPQPAPLTAVRFPFDNVVFPSRAAACYNNTVYRVSLQTFTDILATAASFVDYWYDFEIRQWGGPHTCAYDCCVSVGSTFYFTSAQHPGTIYMSDVDVSPASTYVEFGAALSFVCQSSVLPARGDMMASAVVETTVDLALLGGNNVVNVLMLDESNGVIAAASVFPPVGASVWGTLVWGSGVWGAAELGMRAYNVDWPIPIVFKKASIQLSGLLFPGLRIGNTWMRTEALGYMNVQNPP